MNNLGLKDLKVGDFAGLTRGGVVHLGYVVEKISPSGQITIFNPDSNQRMRFDKKGREYGAGSGAFYTPAYLIVGAEELRDAARRRQLYDAKRGVIKHLRSMGVAVRDTESYDGLVARVNDLSINLHNAKMALAYLGDLIKSSEQ